MFSWKFPYFQCAFSFIPFDTLNSNFIPFAYVVVLILSSFFGQILKIFLDFFSLFMEKNFHFFLILFLFFFLENFNICQGFFFRFFFEFFQKFFFHISLLFILTKFKKIVFKHFSFLPAYKFCSICLFITKIRL